MIYIEQGCVAENYSPTRGVNILGSPGARKLLAGKYGELTPLRQRGGAGFSSSLPSIFTSTHAGIL
jgi:hypothetical protein